MRHAASNQAHQRVSRDEWVLSDDEMERAQGLHTAAAASDTAMAQLLEMGFTPKQAKKVLFLPYSIKLLCCKAHKLASKI